MPVTKAAYASDKLPDETVDAAVIGGGAAGLSGALMLARSRRSVVVIDGGAPRNALAAGVHGLLGLDGVRPAELLRTGRDEVRRYGGLVVAGEVTSAGPAAVVDTPVSAIESTTDGDIAGVRLSDGRLVARQVVAVATRVQARTEGLDGLRLPMRDLPGGMGRSVAAGMAGLTEVPGVWAAGNATDLFAQVGASAAAGALAGAHMNAHLVTADTDADLVAARRRQEN
jgi:thioredoxin reductase